jgi:hypothetical protein
MSVICLKLISSAVIIIVPFEAGTCFVRHHTLDCFLKLIVFPV